MGSKTIYLDLLHEARHLVDAALLVIQLVLTFLGSGHLDLHLLVTPGQNDN